MKWVEMHDAICASGSPLCLSLHAYACPSWHSRAVCLGFGLCVNPSVEAEESPSHFPAVLTVVSLPCQARSIVYREMFTVHTQRHHTNIQCIMLKPASGMLTNAQQRFSDSKVAHMSSPLMNGRPQCEEKVQLLDINDCYVFLSQRRSVKIDNTSSVTVKDRKRSDRMYVFPAVGQRAVSVCSNFLFFSCLDAEWHLTV